MKSILRVLRSAERRVSYFQLLLMSCLPFQPWEAHSLLIEKISFPSHLHSLSKLSVEACKHKTQPQQQAWEAALFLEKKPQNYHISPEN